METNNNKKIKQVIVAGLIALFLIGVGIYFYIYNRPEQRATRQYQKITQEYFNLTPQETDFLRESQKIETILSQYSGFLSPQQEATLRLILGDAVVGIDRPDAWGLFREAALNSEYPNNLRTLALTFIADNYELDFTDRDLVKQMIFSGEVFEDLLEESDGDKDLAMRKLNEWSNALFPNVVANYRIARWYAEQIYKDSGLPEAEKTAIMRKVQEHIAAGDSLLSQYRDSMPPTRLGIALEAKARTLHLAGRIEEAERFFQMALAEYLRPPLTIFQVVHLAQTRFYYSAFLARNYGTARAEEIRNILQREHNYLSTPQPPEKRNVRLVSFLVAARDSESPHYPAIDFNRNDIELISRVYPEFGLLVNKLNLAEYVKGHPLELYISQ